MVGCSTPIARPPETILHRPATDSHPESECVPDFPDRAGWYGADAAYSVPLQTNNGHASLWLFGDTFVKQPGALEGRAYPFIHNSIGISTCTPGGAWSLTTHWRHGDGSSPRAFFTPDAGSDWVRAAGGQSDAYYWPFDGFIIHDTLFIGLLRVASSEARGPFNLPFRLAGMDLARIENFRDPPNEWKIRLSILSNNIKAFPGAAFVETDSHLYAFAFLDRDGGRSPRILCRLDPAALLDWQADLSGHLETWSKDGQWIVGFLPAEAMIVMDDDTSEMSVHYDAARKKWIAIYTDPNRDRITAGPGFVQIRSAQNLTGPWTEPKNLLAIPEMAAEEMHPNVFCYAGKAHPQFAGSNQLLVTYVCNLFTDDVEDESHSLAILESLRTSPNLYRPRAVQIEIPSNQ